MYPVYFFIIGVLMAIVHIIFFETPIIEAFLMSLIVTSIGLTGLYAFIGHFFKSNEVAAKIGWPSGNPFQKETAFANLGFGVVGVMSYWFHDGFWLAIIISEGIFLMGAGYTHIQDMKTKGNNHIYNSGPVLYADILKPLLLFGLYLAYI